MPNKNIGVLYFLGSGQFYNRIDRDNFNTSFVSREEVRKIAQFKTNKRKSGKTEPKIHHGIHHGKFKQSLIRRNSCLKLKATLQTNQLR